MSGVMTIMPVLNWKCMAVHYVVTILYNYALQKKFLVITPII